MRSVNETLTTAGNGFWSGEVREVAITGLEFNDYSYDDSDEDGAVCFGELRVYFDTATWDIQQHGLIYTDKGFIAELCEYLTRAGYDVSDVGYSEQGMQGDNYVSLDVGQEFIKSWRAR